MRCAVFPLRRRSFGSTPEPPPVRGQAVDAPELANEVAGIVISDHRADVFHSRRRLRQQEFRLSHTAVDDPLLHGPAGFPPNEIGQVGGRPRDRLGHIGETDGSAKALLDESEDAEQDGTSLRGQVVESKARQPGDIDQQQLEQRICRHSSPERIAGQLVGEVGEAGHPPGPLRRLDEQGALARFRSLEEGGEEEILRKSGIAAFLRSGRRCEEGIGLEGDNPAGSAILADRTVDFPRSDQKEKPGGRLIRPSSNSLPSFARLDEHQLEEVSTTRTRRYGAARSHPPSHHPRRSGPPRTAGSQLHVLHLIPDERTRGILKHRDQRSAVQQQNVQRGSRLSKYSQALPSWCRPGAR